MEQLLYGVAYYYEYMPYERLEEDARMMKECGINVVRICESTWAYMEPQDGVFSLDYVGRVLDVMHKNGIKVIVGTPTYAIPSWLAKKYPDVLATTKIGKYLYGQRQNMDISNPSYLFYAERMIRKLVEYVHEHPAVIGYQIDNETKHYGTEGDNVQTGFVQYLKKRFSSPEEMNQAYGLNYWSNSIFTWEDMPSTIGTINGSLGCEFSKFQRLLVTDFLAWQTRIVNEYKKPDQFVTQNFDLDWRNGSFGIQANVDHFEACSPLDIAGIDIYHETQDKLDGVTIALGGDLARSMKHENYLVIETQAQSIINSSTQQLPYPGQLRLQAFSHLASGANMVAYWPWHSIHNSMETYWKGLLSHDLEPNPTYLEAKQIAGEFSQFSNHLVNLKKKNKVAIYFSNESLTSIDNWFPFSKDLKYNDVLRMFYETLYNLNVECDFIDHTSSNLGDYKLIIVPLLYSSSDKELLNLNEFAKAGGNIIYSFKSGFTDESVKVRNQRMPAQIREACGFSYQQFSNIGRVKLRDNPYNVTDKENYVSDWAELLVPESATALAKYDHPYWREFAAITTNQYGKGNVTYLGSLPSKALLKEIVLKEILRAGLDVHLDIQFPVIIRNGLNGNGKKIHYFLNYSGETQVFKYPFNNGVEIFTNAPTHSMEKLKIAPWNMLIIEE
jgi:beta-galactosidase